MYKPKFRFLHLLILMLLSVSFFACNNSSEELIPELESIKIDDELLMESYDIDVFELTGLSLILYYNDGSTQKIPITNNMINQIDLELLKTPGTHEITIKYGDFQTNVSFKMTYSVLVTQLRQIYDLGVESSMITGTYEEWIESIKGEDGVSILGAHINDQGHLILTFSNDEVVDVGRVLGFDGIDGRQVILEVQEGFIKWKYHDDTTWHELIALTDLIGVTGSDGVSIQEIDINESFELIIKLSSEEIINLGNIRGEQGLPGLNGTNGIDGKEVMMQVSSGYIQWKYIDDIVWNNLIELTSLIGPKGDTGDQGLPGEDGIDGKEVMMQVSSGYIQWKYIDDIVWNNLIELTSLIGPKGDTGDQGLSGEDGIDGKEVMMQVSSGYIQWKYIDDINWNNLIEIETLTGPQGNGIASMEINTLGELIITYTDASTINLGHISVMYTVNFKGFNSNLIDTQQILYGFAADEPIIPEITGYQFVEWDKTFDFITGHLTVSAIYQIKTYGITFNTQGGAEIDQITDIPHNTSTELPIPIKTGYQFLGWYNSFESNGHLYTNQTAINENLLLKAKWIKLYTLSFETFEGSEIAPIVGSVGSIIYRPINPIKDDYTFMNWYVDEDLSTIFVFSLMPSEDTTLYAKWAKNYLIEYYVSDEIFANNIEFGNKHAATLTIDGRILTWGVNDSGQLGDGTTVSKNYLIDITQQFQLTDEEKITQISLGSEFSAVLTSKNRLLLWGDNFDGQLGDGTTTDSYIPLEINNQFGLIGEETIIKIDLGLYHCSALTSNDRIFTWGYNFYGQLGDGTVENKNIPTDITSSFSFNENEKIKDISLGAYYSVALTTDGRIFTWGHNVYGQLGDGTNIKQETPVDITSSFVLSENEEITQISVNGYVSSAITSNGRVFTWGWNIFGQLGDNTFVNKNVPTEITTNFTLIEDETITNIWLGDYHASALTSDNRVFSWGNNGYGQLGDGTNINKSIPVEITSFFDLLENENIIKLSLSQFNSSALTIDGRIFAWGSNTDGLLANNTIIDSNVPINISIPLKYFLLESQHAGYNTKIYPYIPTFDGYSYSDWYADEELMEGYIFNKMPEENLLLYGNRVPIQYAINYQLNDGINHTDNPLSYTVLSDDIILKDPIKIGYTFNGWYTDEALTNLFTLIEMPYSDITLYAKWLINQYMITYVLIENEDENIFIDLNYGESIHQMSLGDRFSAIITTDGRLIIWGDNNFGQLGDGTTINKLTPIDITNYFNLELDEKITSISMGAAISSALTSSNRVFTWGRNLYGELGDGTLEHRALPTDITGNFNLASGEIITQIFLGWENGSAVSSFGRVFTWGLNDHGQLGNGTTNHQYLPTDITAKFELNVDETIVSLALAWKHSSAITSSGRIFTWGLNNNGQLGDGTLNTKLTPTDITSQFSLDVEEKIIDVSLRGYNSSAITSFGRVFTWGANGSGQLGDGTTTGKLAPTDITSHFTLDTDEKINDISIGWNFAAVTTSLGKIFTWGSNGTGQLGDGSMTTRLVPTDITYQFTLDTNETFIMLNLSGTTSSIITSLNRFFIWGGNSYGEIGDGTTINKTIPYEHMTYSLLITEELFDYNITINEYAPTKVGYTFSGWYVDSSFEEQYVYSTMPAENLTLYGFWIID
jgi:uncharacterized repeat protein (TIGR02543 family)